MKNTRIKVPLPTITTRDEAESTVADIQLITINLIHTTAKMDAELAAVRQRYEGNLAAYTEGLKIKTDTLRAWAEANPSEFPKNRKTIQFTFGTIGFRTGTPKLALLNRRWTWDAVLAALLHFGRYIRTKDEVDREKILAEHAAKAISDAELATLGTRVIQEESFFIDPDITSVETRQTVDAAKEVA